jgi:nicotinamide phosphoribosyltransferase
MFSYIESRGGEYDKTLFFGLQYYLKEYLSHRVTVDYFGRFKQII